MTDRQRSVPHLTALLEEHEPGQSACGTPLETFLVVTARVRGEYQEMLA